MYATLGVGGRREVEAGKKRHSVAIWASQISIHSTDIDRKQHSKKQQPAKQFLPSEPVRSFKPGRLSLIYPVFINRVMEEMQVIIGWGENEDEYRVFPGVIFAAIVHVSTR